ncbi:hypothetical protein SDC9_125178 [bioreactor metagenome]|uniref:Uncharacterized protein n=1 Tax=bioreactor metagenome TaxID=1076179 RepID=A0A645CMN5_9ZZZZ
MAFCSSFFILNSLPNFNKNTNIVISNIPLNTLLIVTLHHTPFSPSISGLDKIYANGTLAPVKIMLIIDGIYVLPRPLNAPIVIISIHINS